jgi:DNA integrity scanning protein DisA with diadenylate cyclase activity
MAFEFLREIGISGFFDIAFMSLLIYSVLMWFKRTKATFVLIGIVIIGLVYLFARLFNLVLTAFVLQAFFAVILVAIIVIFQEELRQLFGQVPEKLRQFFEQIPERVRTFFERIPIWGMNTNVRREKSMSSVPK